MAPDCAARFSVVSRTLLSGALFFGCPICPVPVPNSGRSCVPSTPRQYICCIVIGPHSDASPVILPARPGAAPEMLFPHPQATSLPGNAGTRRSMIPRQPARHSTRSNLAAIVPIKFNVAPINLAEKYPGFIKTVFVMTHRNLHRSGGYPTTHCSAPTCVTHSKSPSRIPTSVCSTKSAISWNSWRHWPG